MKDTLFCFLARWMKLSWILQEKNRKEKDLKNVLENSKFTFGNIW